MLVLVATLIPDAVDWEAIGMVEICWSELAVDVKVAELTTSDEMVSVSVAVLCEVCGVSLIDVCNVREGDGLLDCSDVLLGIPLLVDMVEDCMIVDWRLVVEEASEELVVFSSSGAVSWRKADIAGYVESSWPSTRLYNTHELLL